MNLKNLFRTLLVLLFFVGVASAQTFYVNNQTGDDANAGTLASPKKTVGSALIAAPSGSTIDVAATGLNYTEGNITISGKTFTFNTTGATVFPNAAFSVGAAAPVVLGAATISGTNPAVFTSAAHGLVSGDVIYVYGTGVAGMDNQYWTVTVLTPGTFSIAYDNTANPAEAATTAYRTRGTATFTGAGTFQFNGGLNLNAGTIANGDKLLVGTGVYRTELGSISAGQLGYTGVIPFTYDDVIAGASTITTGFELPVVTNRAGALNVNTTSTSVLTLKLDQDRTVGNGNTAIISAAGNLINLDGKTLTVVGNAAHTFGGAVSNFIPATNSLSGKLLFNITGGNVTVAGAVGLPNIEATSTDGTSAALRTLTLAGTSATSLLANGNTSITANAITDVNLAGNTTTVVTNSSNGVITLNAVANIRGNVLLNATGVTGVGGLAQIQFGMTAPLKIWGNVTNSAGIVLSGAAISNNGVINFADVAAGTLEITGNVLLNGALSGNSVAATNYTANGEIRFNNTIATRDVTINGSVTNSATSTASATAAGGTVSTNMRILFGATTAVVRADGGFANSSSIPSITAFATTNANNGGIVFTARTTGTIGLAGNRVGAVINTSTSATITNGVIDFGGVDPAGTFFGTTIEQGTAAAGGDIMINSGIVNLTGALTNNRTAAGADISIGAGGAGTVTHALVNIQNNGASDIIIDLTGNDLVTSTGTLGSGAAATGTINFAAAGTGALTFNAINVAGGTVTVPATHAANIIVNTSFTLSGGTVNFLADGGARNLMVGGATPNSQAGNIIWTAGTLVTTGRPNISVSGIASQIGGATTNPTLATATTTLQFVQPIPNVMQEITFGTADPTMSGPFVINNTAVTPAPYVRLKSLGGSTTPANFYVLNNVTFSSSTQAGVVNVIEISNVRVNVGKNGVGGGNGNFQNTSGYTTVGDARVMMSGTSAVQTVNAAAADAGATFGNFGVDNERVGANDVTFGTASTLAGDFLLAEGDVNLTNTTFSGTAPWPTVFRTEGTFSTIPTVAASTFINVTYYGSDKATANETGAGVPVWNLTVATTNGASPGKGIVSLGGAITVNGTLTINTDQSLYTGANNLTLAGASAVNNGWLVDNGVTRLILARATGTALTGTGVWPSVQVNANSLGNTLADGTGLVSQGFGADGVWAGGDDDLTTKDGVITFIAATATTPSSFGVSFTGNGPHVANITTAAYGTLNLNSNVVSSGTVAVGTGTIALGDFNLTCQAAAPSMTITGAAVAPFGQVTSGTGTAIFSNAASGITVAGAAATIGANVHFTGAAATFAGFNVRVNGNLTLGTTTPAVNTTFTIPNTLTLTAGGLNVTLNGTSNFTTPASGILQLLNNAPNVLLTFNTPTAGQTVANLQLDGNVTFAGANALTVNGTGSGFVMNSGTMTISNSNLNIGAGVGGTATPFVYNGGTIAAGTGYLVWNSTSTWTQTAPLTINNFEVDLALDITKANANLIANTLTVTNNLYLNNAVLRQTRTVAPTGSVLNVNALAQIRVDGTGNIDNVAGQLVPNYAGLVNYLFGGATSSPNSLTWPTNQANNVTLNNTGAVNVDINPASNKVIAGTLTLTSGTLRWDAGTTISMPTAGQKIIRNVNGALNNNGGFVAGTGTFTAADVNIDYTGNPAYNTGLEYSAPTIVRDLTLLAMTLPAQTQVNVASSRTIAGVLTMNSILNFLTGTTTNFTLGQTNAATGTITTAGTAIVNWNGGLVNNGTYTNDGTTVIPTGMTLTGTGAYNNTVAGGVLTANGNTTINNMTLVAGQTINANANLTFTGTVTGGNNLTTVFGGADAQAFTVPGNVTLGPVTLAKSSDAIVTLSGGNLTLAAGSNLTLTRGVLTVSGANSLLTLNLTTIAGTPNIVNGFGFVRNPVSVTHLAHIVGRVGVAVGVNTIGRIEWPVGSATKYRPAAITFTAGNATIAPTTIIVGHVDTDPTGIKNFPVDGGVKFTDATKKLWIAGRAPYYWTFEATTSLGASQKFDVELNGTNLNKPLENHNDLRIIRRFDGDVTVNGWFLEGAGNSYSNAMYVNSPNVGDTLLVVRNVASVGSAIAQKALFTLGLPSLKPIFTATAPAAVTVAENATYNFTFAANDQDVTASAITYSLQGTVPANATINATTGVFEFKPDYTQSSVTPYSFTVRAAKANDLTSYSEYIFAVTVTNTNRVPSFTATGAAVLTNSSISYGIAKTFTYIAKDADNETLTYTVAITPAPAGTFSISNAFGSVGLFTFTPAFADYGKVFAVNVTATDPNAAVATTTANLTITGAYQRGDANLSGGAPDVNDAIKILEHVVGKITLTAEQQVYADAKQDGVIGAVDASYVLYYIANGTWPTFKTVATAGTVEFAKMSSENGVLSLPLALNGSAGITSIYAEADLNNANIEISKVNMRLPEGWLVSTSTENGKVRIAAAGTTAINDGVFATVEVKLKDKETAVSIVGSAKLNDELSSSLTAKVREIPSEFALSQNYPNPFNPTTSIKFQVAQDAKVSLVVYNLLGQKVRTIVDGIQEAGFYTVRWDGSNDFGSKVSSGIYIYRLQAGNFVSTMKMNLMK